MPRPAALPLAVALLGAGCAPFQDLRELIDGYTARLVVQGSVIGIEDPDDPRTADALAETELGSGVQARVWLADAAGASDLDAARLRGLAPTLTGGGTDGEPWTLEEVGPGEYELTGDDGLAYVDDDAIRVRARWGDEAGAVRLGAPGAPDLEIPWRHGVRESMFIDLSAWDVDQVLVMVLDLDHGNGETWSNLPRGAEAALAMRAGGKPTLVIPLSAFPVEGHYAVGVAAAQVAGEAALDGVNVAASGLLSAKFRFSTVCTYEDEAACVPPEAAAATDPDAADGG